MKSLNEWFQAHKRDLTVCYEAHRNSVAITYLDNIAILRVAGYESQGILNRELTANLENLPEQAIRLTLMLSPTGKILADILVYNNFDSYFLVMNTACKSVVYERFKGYHGDNFEVEDVTAQWAFIAVEGPEAETITEPLVNIDSLSLRLLNFEECTLEDTTMFVARVGFTGEFGFLFLVEQQVAVSLVMQMRELVPSAVLCDTEIYKLLWLEVRSFNLDLDLPKRESVISAGLHWMVDFRKEAFTGKDAVLQEVENPPKYKLIGVKSDIGIFEVSAQAELYEYDKPCGYVAHWAYSPECECIVGLAYIEWERAWVGLDFEARTAKGNLKVTTATTPFLITKSNKVNI